MSKPLLPTWKVMRFSDIAKLEYGRSLPVKHRKSGPYPVVGSAGIIDHHNEAYLEQPGIVVGRKGSIGNVSWLQEESFPIDTTYYVDADRKFVDYKWLFYFLSNQDLPRFNRATGVPGLNRDDVYALQVLLPPLDEQKRIASILGSVEKAIEQTDNVIAKTEQLRDALLHKLLTRGIPDHHLEWKEIPGLGTIPATWQVVRLGDIAKVDRGISWSREQEFDTQVEDSIPVVRIGNVQRDGFHMKDVLNIVGITDKQKAVGHINTDTLIMVGSNGNPDRVGNLYLADDSVIGCLLASFLIGITPTESVMASFLAFYLRYSPVQSKITDSTAGSTGLKNLSLKWLRSLFVPLPSLSEQHQIISIIKKNDRSINELKKESEALQDYAKSLSHRLMNYGLPHFMGMPEDD